MIHCQRGLVIVLTNNVVYVRKVVALSVVQRRPGRQAGIQLRVSSHYPPPKRAADTKRQNIRRKFHSYEARTPAHT